MINQPEFQALFKQHQAQEALQAASPTRLAPLVATNGADHSTSSIHTSDGSDFSDDEDNSDPVLSSDSDEMEVVQPPKKPEPPKSKPKRKRGKY